MENDIFAICQVALKSYDSIIGLGLKLRAWPADQHKETPLHGLYVSFCGGFPPEQ
jgi:hypothetical protein